LIRDPCWRSSNTTLSAIRAELVEAVFASCVCGLPCTCWPGVARRQLTFLCLAKERRPYCLRPPSLALRGQPAVLGPAGAGLELAALRQSPVLIRLDLRSSAHTEGWEIKAGTESGTQSGSGEVALCASSPPRIGIGFRYYSPPPVRLGRGAQAKADQGERLSEPKASSSETPLLPSTAGCPEAQRRGPRLSGRLFFGDFLLAKQKKVTCRRATPGQQANHTS
jgi:hypothetical protein